MKKKVVVVAMLVCVFLGAALVLWEQVGSLRLALGIERQQTEAVQPAPKPVTPKAPRAVEPAKPVASPSVKLTGPKNGPVTVKWSPEVKFAD